MKLLKRLALPVMALLVVTFYGCGKPLEPGAGSATEGGGSGLADIRSMRDRAALEEANAKLQSCFLRTGQALTLTQIAIQSKLHDNSKLDTPAPAAQDHAAEPPQPSEGVSPAPGAPEAAASPGAPAPAEPGAKVEGAAAPEPIGPVMPELIPPGTLANEMVGQAFALLDQVRADAKSLAEGKFKDHPRVKSLLDLIVAAEQLVKVAAGMEPVNKDVAELIAKAEQAAAPADAAAPAAPQEGASAAPAAPDAHAPAAPAAPAPGAPAPADAMAPAAPMAPPAAPPPGMPVPSAGPLPAGPPMGAVPMAPPMAGGPAAQPMPAAPAPAPAAAPPAPGH